MKRSRKRPILLVVVYYAFFSRLGLAETSLWKIDNGNNTLFIGGTVHVLRSEDYPLPREFEQAYKQAKNIIYETDLAAINSAENQLQLAQRLKYPPGQSLAKHLSEQTYRSLRTYANSAGIPLQALNQFKPAMVMITLLTTELNKLGMASTGVDRYFWQKTLSDQKKVGALESLETQFNILENMGIGYEDEMILSTLSDVESLSSTFNDMISAWRGGNLKRLKQLAILPMQTEFPAVYRSILIDRNNAWLPQIEAWLKTAETELVLVGVLHLVGKEGLIERLRAKGYSVEFFHSP